MNVFDITHKGCLDYSSFVQGIQRASPDTDENQAKQIFNEIDDNGNKFVEFEEFIIAFLEDEEMMNIKVLQQIFDYIMEDKDYLQSQLKSKSMIKISIQQLRKRIEMEDEDYNYYFNYLKEKGKENISQSEFVNFFRNVYMQEVL